MLIEKSSLRQDEKGEEIKFNDKEEALKLFESLKDNKACLLKDLKTSVVETKPKSPLSLLRF